MTLSHRNFLLYCSTRNSLHFLHFLKQEVKAEELIDRAPTLKDKAEVLSEEMPKPSPEPAASTDQAMVRL